MLEAESLGKVLPGVESAEEGTEYPYYIVSTRQIAILRVIQFQMNKLCT